VDDKLEKAFRALAGSSAGPFHAVAYGVEGEVPQGTLRGLRALLKKEDLDPESPQIVEGGDRRRAALERPLFKSEILGRLEAELRKGSQKGRKGKPPPAPLEGRGAPGRARERLSALSAQLPELLGQVDRTLSGLPPPAEPSLSDDALEGVRPPEEPVTEAPPAPMPQATDSRDLVFLLLVRRFEDLGSAAEAVSGALKFKIERGAHVVVHDDGLDTRTREGRALARLALRLGDLRAVRARERAIEDLDRKRHSLKVYGPVPYGFTREGEELKPMGPELAAVKRIRELYRLEQTPVTIAVTLNREKHRWKDGSLWTWRRVAQIRKNPLYDRVFSEPRP
jgi:hypothetical protein